ncbi:hypothetical protein ABFS83_11G133100 [Erythranthe nasuta]
MKSPLWKLTRLGLNKTDPESEDNSNHRLNPVHVDGLTQASKDMKDMRTCYDGLLSAAAATANSAYEFSESLLEMGNCLLEKTAMHDDGESGVALTLLGRVQLELQKFVDSYRSHIIMTITHPSESLLSELRKVEEMKLQSDEKRETFEYMVGQLREKGKSRHGKGETFTSEQLQAVREEYDEAARLCVFRVESLKQGQCRSLLTQAARHHAAQLNFFRKGLQSLEAVEPHIRNVAEKQHIDYEICKGNDEEEGNGEGNSYKTNEDGDSNFDYSPNEKESANISTSKNPMELDQLGAQTSRMKNVEVQQRRAGSHSAPLYAEKFDSAEKRTSSAQKLNRHVLPTPHDGKGTITSSIPLLSSTKVVGGSSKNLWHSSPLALDIEKHSSQIPAEEKSRNKHFLPLPPPPLMTDGFETRKIKTQSFSGPLVGKPSSIEVCGSWSLNAPPPPLVSELHQLPRPPDYFGSKNKIMHTVGAPTDHMNKKGSPLPLPHLTVSRSFSIPSSSSPSSLQRGIAD